jgi:phenylalanyl-tRNA synthetase beta chain
MRLSYNWLKEYVSLDGVSPQQLAERMTTAGLEVEGIEPVASGTNLVIGEVLSCEPHPDSDHLHVAKTRVGENDVRQIVCGAPNCRAGLKVIAALPGLNCPAVRSSSR